MFAKTLNEILAGKKIVSVEEGGTHGWLLIHFDAVEFKNGDGNPLPVGMRVYVTMKVGGPQEDPHYADCSLHFKEADGSGILYHVNDHRDPATLWPSPGTEPWWEKKP
jgi:hypothetical protein